MAGSEPRSEGSLADTDMLMSQTSGTSGLERMSADPKIEFVCVEESGSALSGPFTHICTIAY